MLHEPTDNLHSVTHILNGLYFLHDFLAETQTEELLLPRIQVIINETILAIIHYDR